MTSPQKHIAAAVLVEFLSPPCLLALRAKRRHRLSAFPLDASVNTTRRGQAVLRKAVFGKWLGNEAFLFFSGQFSPVKY